MRVAWIVFCWFRCEHLDYPLYLQRYGYVLLISRIKLCIATFFKVSKLCSKENFREPFGLPSVLAWVPSPKRQLPKLLLIIQIIISYVIGEMFRTNELFVDSVDFFFVYLFLVSDTWWLVTTPRTMRDLQILYPFLKQITVTKIVTFLFYT